MEPLKVTQLIVIDYPEEKKILIAGSPESLELLSRIVNQSLERSDGTGLDLNTIVLNQDQEVRTVLCLRLDRALPPSLLEPNNLLSIWNYRTQTYEE
jgi:hypothetical protein